MTTPRRGGLERQSAWSASAAVPEDVALLPGTIGCDAAGTLPGLFARRVALTPDQVAYRAFGAEDWQSCSWRAMARLVARWQAALASEGLAPGERVAVGLPNGIDWVCVDQAALGLGLVTVPLYVSDSPGNLAHILEDSGARLLVLDSEAQWSALAPQRERLAAVGRVLCRSLGADADDPRLRRIADWLPGDDAPIGEPQDRTQGPDALATLIYTSGTTGPSKAVMLSHRNILWNAEAVLHRIPAYPSDEFLSFLPLAHAFERTVGCYLPMMAGCPVAYARSIEQLREDLLVIRPRALLSVPRIYDKIYVAIHEKVGEQGPKRRLLEATVAIGWRRHLAARGRGPAPSLRDWLLWPLLERIVARPVLDRLGGRLRVAVSGGAPLAPTVARFFIGLGLPLTEGYGLTEAAPVVTATEPRDCLPGCVGTPLPGIETRLGPAGELLVRAPSVMMGYWNRPEETARAVDRDGWLHTGDIAERRDGGYLAIGGRLKEILVLSTGHKIAPMDMEMALTMDPLIEQAMVVGEGRQYPAAMLVLSERPWQRLAAALGLDPQDPASLADPRVIDALLARTEERLAEFPDWARLRALHPTLAPWTITDGLITPTMKIKRDVLEGRFAAEIAELYAQPRRRPGEAAPASPPGRPGDGRRA
ncbi:long-chain fatty acid--CoA ligase [Thiococcus pfennigii]|nr:long-chain fatty acid--CoA ligase [Thiococcus pfennigii]